MKLYKKIIITIISFIFIILLFPFKIINLFKNKKKYKSSKIKNILLIIPYLNNGGAERSIINLSSSLSKKYNVNLLVVNKRFNDYKTNVNIIEVPELKKKLTKIIGIKKIKKIKKDLNIDVSISYITTFNFLNVVSKSNDKVIISNRNYLSKKETKIIPNILHIVASIYADVIVNCSKAVMYDQIKSYPYLKNKMVVIPNFVDPNSILLESKKNINKDIEKIMSENVIISIGRLAKVKRHDVTIKAFHKIYKKLDNTNLIIIGSGPLKNELINLINKLNLQDRVFILDFDPNPYKYLIKSNLLILSSEYEGCPNVILEAINCNIPVIASDSFGGVSEILSKNPNFKQKVKKEIYSDYGVLYPIGDIEALARAILKMESDYNLKNKYKNLEELKEKYSEGCVLEKWQKIL